MLLPIPDFTYILIPIANHGDLEKLLEMPKRPVPWNTNEVVFVSLVVLASVLDAVHVFSADLLGIHVTDYHHDLAPRNMLVNVTSFILADFGLPHLKDAVDRSSTSFKDN